MIKKPKVGILASPSLSGNMVSVLTNLARLVGGDFELHLVTGRSTIPNSIVDFYAVHRYSSFSIDPGDLRYSFFSFRNFAIKEETDLLMNICKPQTLGLIVTLIGNYYDIPTLIRMTGETFRQTEIFSSPYLKLKYWFLHDIMARETYKKANHIVPVGNSLKDSLIMEGFSADKITVRPQPFEPRPFEVNSNLDKEGLKRELGLVTSRKTVLFVGRLSWLKGADRLVEIVETVREESQKFQFCFVGDGEYKERLGQYSNDLVYLGGSIPRNQISKYYKASDLFVFPSRTEGLPNVILEALAAELPIIASPVGEIPNYIDNTAKDVEDYVEVILEGDWRSDSLPDTFGWKEQKKAYMSLFKDVIGSHKDVEKRNE